MPKYYRFRATTPTRKPKRKEREHKDVERAKPESAKRWLDLLYGPAVSWYLRRVGWRDPLGLTPGIGQRSPLTLTINNRPIFAFKIPATN